ncbi:MAG: hypothetical protein SO101_05130 [Lachnospiraceae bacterium]|nr:hypothetical protein [Lachnospiraceae bacterium]
MKNMRKNIPFQNLAADSLKEAAQSGTTLDVRMEDGATVVSARFTVETARDVLEQALSAELQELAARVYAHEGIIGHIKASTEISSVQMYSITDTILHVKNGENDTIIISFAFILFLIDAGTAEKWTREIIERIQKL